MTIDVLSLPDKVNNPDPVELAKDRIPEFSGENEFLKKRYLVYRIFDFNVTDAADMSGVRYATVLKWRRDDQAFRDWEMAELPNLRKNIMAEMTLSQFYRNMWMAMMIDAKLLGRAVVEGIIPIVDENGKYVSGLRKEEREYLEKTRGRYSAESLHSLLRVASGDLSQDKSTLIVETVYISGPRGGPVEPEEPAENGL